MSQQIVQRCRCRTGAVCYALRIRIIHDHSAAPALGSAICYALRIRIMHHSAAPALGNAIDYASRIRIMYQEPKARRRGLCTTHYVSVICITRAESPPERAMYYALRIRIMYQAPKKLNILSFALASETRDSHHPYTGEMGVRLAPTCPDCTG